MQRALVTGSRRWTDEATIWRVVKELSLNAVVLHGGADGADAIADRAARSRGLAVEVYEADWDSHGKAAGPLRNERMVSEGRPTEAHAFPLPSSSGTWDAVRRLRSARVPVTVYGSSADSSELAQMLAAYGDTSRLSSFDSETYKFSNGLMAPQIVCASTSRVVGDKIVGQLHPGPRAALEAFRACVADGGRVVLAKSSYDLAVIAQHDPELLGAIFRAIKAGLVECILIRQGLDAIYHGHLGYNPDGSELRKPRTGEVTNRYSLEIVTQFVLGRLDAKENDAWKESYALLAGIDPKHWPTEARRYPVDDSDNTLESFLAQAVGRPGGHEWKVLPRLPGDDDILDSTVCEWCGIHLESAHPSELSGRCRSAPWQAPGRNTANAPAQVMADLCLNLGAAHSLRTDPEKVTAFAKEVDAKHEEYVKRFQGKGWIREDGTEDQAAVKRSIALAYGTTGTCKRCGGGVECKKCVGAGGTGSLSCTECGGTGKLVGKVQKWKEIPCRGEKIKGRFRGCLGDDCKVCHGAGKHEIKDGIVTCKNVYGEDDSTIERGCDGTGLDLKTAPLLPRTKNKEHPKREGGVATDRDTAMGSGDDDVSDYGENEFEKSRSTYIPYLRKGITEPLWIQPNVLVATGRCSYENCPVHQFPRSGGERGCIRARGKWCGYPVEMVFGSSDYSAGELCTLAQYTYWLFKYSRMRDVINETGDPGILHSALAAEVLGLPLDEFLKRLKAGDKQCKDFRQASKPKNFGAPAGMGSPKIVATNRKKNSGFTPCAGGPHRNKKGEEGYCGIRFCILVAGKKSCGSNKITTWGKRNTPCAPVCKDCVEVEANILSPAYIRRYPEMKDYFDWVTKMVDKKRRAPSLVWDPDRGRPKIVRERGGCDFPAFCNNGFQSMLADIGKDAYCTMTRECYLGVKDDGSPSPLAGCRIPLFVHDEPFSELILDTAHLSGPRIAEIGMESGRRMAPDVVWKMDTALAFWWDKEMSAVHHPVTGNLVPWGPVPDYLKERFAA